MFILYKCSFVLNVRKLTLLRCIMCGFFNFDSVVVGTQLSVEKIQEFINELQQCKEVPIHGVGEFVCFVPCRSIVEHVGMLNMAPDGATILVREHYEVDIRCQKYGGKWYIYDVVDRRH